jgi:hypothetical protein
MDNEYERVQHERLVLKVGFAQSWLEVVCIGAAGHRTLSADEQLIQQLAISATSRGGRSCGPELDAVIHAIGPRQALAVLMLVGRYVCHALIANALALAPPGVIASPENGS